MSPALPKTLCKTIDMLGHGIKRKGGVSLKIHLAKTSGFCFGVRRALEVASQTIKSRKNVYMLGDIVHNEKVVRQINRRGLKKIKKLKPGKDKTLLIRAHGASVKTFAKARALGYEIVDATCPMVQEIHKIAKRMEEAGYKIIVVGDKKHDEVQGIVGQLRQKAIVIEDARRISLKTLGEIKKAAVVAQSTQNTQEVLEIVKVLKERIRELKFFNTICRPTRTKQEEIKVMPLKNDVVIIIGSKTSANTKRLYQIAKSLNKRSYWVQSSDQIKPGWFKGVRNVGVAAGASTPDTTTKDVIKRIHRLFPRQPSYK